MPLFLDIYFLIHIKVQYEVDEEQIYKQHFARGLLLVLSAGCGLLAWMHWSCIDEFGIGFTLYTVEELYSFFPIGS